MDALRTSMPRLWVVVVLGLVAALLPVMSPTSALADAGLEQRFIASINAERTGAGLSPLALAGDLTTAARRHAATMARADDLHHNPNLGSAVGGWDKLGENVGRGPEVGAIHQAFMDSPGHRRNVLDPAFTEVGIGVVVHEGQIWVTEMFRWSTAASAPPPPPPPAEPEPATPAAPAPTADAETAPSTPPADDEAGAPDAGTGADAIDAPTRPDEPAEREPGAGADSAAVPLQRDRLMLVQMRVAVHDA